MEVNGIVRKIDELGRVVLPKQFRQRLGFDCGAQIDIYCENDSLVIKKHIGKTLEETIFDLERSLSDNSDGLDQEQIKKIGSHLEKIKSLL